MIINPVGSSASEFVTEKNNRASKDGIDASFADRTGVRATLFSDTSSISSLVAKTMQLAEGRQYRVEMLKAAISNGSYQLDAGAIASSVLKEQAL